MALGTCTPQYGHQASCSHFRKNSFYWSDKRCQFEQSRDFRRWCPCPIGPDALEKEFTSGAHQFQSGTLFNSSSAPIGTRVRRASKRKLTKSLDLSPDTVPCQHCRQCLLPAADRVGRGCAASSCLGSHSCGAPRVPGARCHPSDDLT